MQICTIAAEKSPLRCKPIAKNGGTKSTASQFYPCQHGQKIATASQIATFMVPTRQRIQCFKGENPAIAPKSDLDWAVAKWRFFPTSVGPEVPLPPTHERRWMDSTDS
jgi:hypothetical protein